MPFRDYLFQDAKIKTKPKVLFDELYKTMFRWYENNDYAFHERQYLDKEGPLGRQLELYWTGERIIDSYVKFVIEINFLILGFKDVEVERNGIKEKLQTGTFEIRMSAYLEKDYNDKWSRNDFTKWMRKMYDAIITRERLERYEEELYMEALSAMDELKATMTMRAY